jgi:hypothetical protein
MSCCYSACGRPLLRLLPALFSSLGRMVLQRNAMKPLPLHAQFVCVLPEWEIITSWRLLLLMACIRRIFCRRILRRFLSALRSCQNSSADGDG